MIFSFGAWLQARSAPAALPIGETGCASVVDGFAGTRLQDTVLGRRRPCQVPEAGRKVLRGAPRSEPFHVLLQ